MPTNLRIELEGKMPDFDYGNGVYEEFENYYIETLNAERCIQIAKMLNTLEELHCLDYVRTILRGSEV